MCFSNECEWCAEICDIAYSRAEDLCHCAECCRQIEAGEWRQHVYQQENADCQLCEYEDADPATCEHDYGEAYDADICRECCLLLEAVYDFEAKEGCPEYARQPMYGELAEEINNDQHYGDNRYVAYAVALFPELENHPFCSVE